MGSASKKTAHAAEQERPDVVARRQVWFDAQPDLDPEKLIFIDETGAATKMARLRGRSKRGMWCSHQLPPKHHIAKIIDQWAAEVEAQSNGDIDVQIFGANSLRGAKQNIAAVAKGDIECAFSVNFQWGKTVPTMNVTMRPYTVADLDVELFSR